MPFWCCKTLDFRFCAWYNFGSHLFFVSFLLIIFHWKKGSRHRHTHNWRHCAWDHRRKRSGRRRSVLCIFLCCLPLLLCLLNLLSRRLRRHWHHTHHSHHTHASREFGHTFCQLSLPELFLIFFIFFLIVIVFGIVFFLILTN